MAPRGRLRDSDNFTFRCYSYVGQVYVVDRILADFTSVRDGKLSQKWKQIVFSLHRARYLFPLSTPWWEGKMSAADNLKLLAATWYE